MKSILAVLPKKIAEQLLYLSPKLLAKTEEIRIRVNKRLELIVEGRPIYPTQAIVTEDEALQLLSNISQFSIYTIEQELQQGYITIEGGHRIGLAGKVITENGRVKAIRNVTSFNIRVAKQSLFIADKIVAMIYREKWLNTMIIGRPQTGKTTLLRDIARIMSSGSPEHNIHSVKVGIVDERSEIAGCVKGVPQHILGERVDVLDACPKAEGIMMMIRSMSPDVIVVDEIGRKEDAEAIMEAVHAGVSLVVTAHGDNLEDVCQRPSIAPLIDQGVFQRYIELTNRGKVGTINRIRTKTGGDLFDKEKASVSGS